MKKIWKGLAAGVLSLSLAVTSAWALTPAQLGDILEEKYAGEIPAGVWKETTVEGMLKALGDRFTRYLSPEKYADFLGEMSETGEDGPSVTAVLEDGRIGAVELRTFGPDTYEILKQAVVNMDDSVDKWIVDVRGNSGGSLKATVDAVSVFTGGGQLAYLRDKADKVYVSKGSNGSQTMDPVIVLVDSHTASGGELFAADVRDCRAGLVIGGRTYGKGVAQTAFTKEEYPEAFADGSALLVTTGRLFSQGYVSNNMIGVLPHIVVEDALAPRVARLLCAASPLGNKEGYLRIHLGGWRWYVSLAQARTDMEAFRALLEALPPQAEVYQGVGTDWMETSADLVAAAEMVDGYTPRTFADVASSSPYAEAINALKTYGIIQGNENGDFLPKEGLDRATLCALLAQAMNYPQTEGEPAFSDTPAEAWYTPYVNTLSALGIVNGYDDGLFHPNDPIPHQQFMTILARVAANVNQLSYASLQTGPSEEELASGRYDAFDPWARSGAWLLDGAWHADVTAIDPKGVTLREEAAYDLWSMLAVMGIVEK